jgi:hypothetical protein
MHETNPMYRLGMAAREKPRKQTTEKGLEIPVPTKGDFDANLAKVAPPAGRKRPGGKDRPQKRSS